MLNRYAVKSRIEGSNPSVSAIVCLFPKDSKRGWLSVALPQVMGRG